MGFGRRTGRTSGVPPQNGKEYLTPPAPWQTTRSPHSSSRRAPVLTAYRQYRQVPARQFSPPVHPDFQTGLQKLMTHKRMQGTRIGSRGASVVYAFEIRGNIKIIAVHNASLS